MLTSPRYLALKELSSVHGVGSVTARRLYDLGLRTVDDMRNYYGVDVDDDTDDMSSQMLEKMTEVQDDEVGIKAALRVYDDINTL